MLEPAEPRERVTRVVNFSVPLSWLLGLCVSIGWALISTYFAVGQLVRTVEELQIMVKSGNSQVVSLQSEMAILRLRVENLEYDAGVRGNRVQPSTMKR